MSPPPNLSKTFSKPVKPETSRFLTVLLFWVFVVLVTGGIIWMVVTDPGERSLTCGNRGGQVSMTAFGSCTEDN